MTQLSDGVDPEWAVLMSPSDRALDTPKNTPKNTPPDTPQKPPQKGGSRGGENPGGKFRENFPGPGGPGRPGPGGPPGRPREPPRDTPRDGPFWALIMVYLFRNGVNPPPGGTRPGVHFWHPPGGVQKVHIFLGI